MLNRISSGWMWLETAINALIDEVNRQKPLASATIAVEESPNGTLLKVTSPQEAGAGAGGGIPEAPTDGKLYGRENAAWVKVPTWPPGVGWQLLAVIDNSSGTCVTKYIYYWGTAVATSPGSPPAMPS